MILKTDTSSLASRESRNRFGPFPNKIQNNTPLEINLTGNGPPTIMAETPLVKHISFIYYPIKLYSHNIHIYLNIVQYLICRFRFNRSVQALGGSFQYCDKNNTSKHG